jgi:hypothetical protein
MTKIEENTNQFLKDVYDDSLWMPDVSLEARVVNTIDAIVQNGNTSGPALEALPILRGMLMPR